MTDHKDPKRGARRAAARALKWRPNKKSAEYRAWCNMRHRCRTSSCKLRITAGWLEEAFSTPIKKRCGNSKRELFWGVA